MPEGTDRVDDGVDFLSFARLYDARIGEHFEARTATDIPSLHFQDLLARLPAEAS